MFPVRARGKDCDKRGKYKRCFSEVFIILKYAQRKTSPEEIERFF